MTTIGLRDWTRDLALVSGLVAATIIPMGIHTAMLDGLGIPDPTHYPKTGWPVLPDRVMMMAGVIYLARAMGGMTGGRRPIAAILCVFLCTAAINQDLLRDGIMRNSVSTKWTIYPFLDNLPMLLTIAVVSGLAVAAARLRTRWAWLLAAVGLALVYELVKREMNTLFAGFTAMTNGLEGDTKYFVPYDWRVNLPSYLSFAEPVLGACGVAAVFARRRGSRVLQMITAAVTIFAIAGGPLFKPFLNIGFSSDTPLIAVLSSAQFTFESLALAVLVAGLWIGLRPRVAAAAPPPR